ncbi:MAG: LysM peptidoglycan-binding domain-containing protein [Desulfuromonadales bacterium]|nr:LysM peptidoglycan-binding domain-containing protein [Desulfuromonadales bacterium]
MRCRSALTSLLVFCLLTACSTPAPTWRVKAAALVEDLVKQDTRVLFPQEYLSLLETFEHGEAVLHVQGDEVEADVLYLLTLQKGSVLKDELYKRKLRLAEEERQRAAAEAARIEQERLMLQAAEAEARLREQEQRAAQLEAQKAVAKKETIIKELLQQQTLSYTVRRGETLPQIAARTEIYNDSSLWPLIYRANRDQIRDPRQLWPGQNLKIPRHFTRDEAQEAKRYSGKK